MSSAANERALEILQDLDAHLAGLQVSYSEENATAARELIDELEECFELQPAPLIALRDAVDAIVEDGDQSEVPTAKEQADKLKRQVEAELDDE